MRKVLIIAPDFTPSSYPPALRVRFFVSHLPEFGWKPTVVTVDPKYYEWPIEPENEKLLPKSLEIIRTKCLPAKWTRKIGIGDIGLRSLWAYWRAVKSLCRNRNFDLVFISIPPYFPALLGRMVYESFKIPYVIDYIDPWRSANDRSMPGAQRSLKRALSYFLSRPLEPWVLRRASHIVVVSKGTTDSVLARCLWFKKENTTEIPYGGEAADFYYLARHPRQNTIFNHRGNFLHMSYVGRGGADVEPGVRAVFEAVKLGLKRSPQLFGRLRLHFVGTSYDPQPPGPTQISAWAREAGLKDYIDEHPARISYLDAIQVLLDSHGLLAVGSKLPHYTASKIFPYILAGKPLLAVFREESNVVDILKETKAGRLVTFGDQGLNQDKILEISRQLEHILSLPPGTVSPVTPKVFEPYTTRAMTRRLAQVFEKVIAKG